ncbi:hypothetical protein EYS42_07575 [Aquabacterium lacunae]|uniref:TonB-dependent receptor n=1 Tax=Aquabacterium lacunae TaxID=2528630 RepID=A0A4Q9H059_9BURK|nr:hypothetical protein [Aquabacterium lacunae]TBO31103.1 hypothetical protein EYS42_07575 [Aquabacterium lacunae]
MTSFLFHRSSLSLAVALSCLSAQPVLANGPASPADIQRLQQELRELRQQYEGRLQHLEQQLQQALQRPAPSTAAAPQDATTPGTAQAGNASANRYNPAISLVLSGVYAHLQQDPGTWGLGQFMPGDGELGPGEKGLRLGESELRLSASIDPWWSGVLNLALTPENEAEVEEAFVQSTALLDGLTLKAGRFRSGLGYLNEQHPHTWDFVDAPLPQQAFLAGGLGHDGLQARLLLPTEQFVELGAEAGRGATADNGAGSTLVFARTGGDIGTSHNWRLGVSHLWERGLSRSWEDAAGLNHAFEGRSRLWAIDGVWKWAPNGNAKSTSFKLQGEVYQRDLTGDLQADTAGAASTDAFGHKARGYYVQGVYQFAPRWRLGLRHDEVSPGTPMLGANTGLVSWNDHTPQRQSLMLDYAPSEFSRWRVQVNNDRVRSDLRDTQVFLQYQMSLGAHGAHSY